MKYLVEVSYESVVGVKGVVTMKVEADSESEIRDKVVEILKVDFEILKITPVLED